VLFAKRLGIVSEFYQAVFGARVSGGDAQHAVLDFGGFDLMIHQIPQHLAVAVAVTSPPERREQTAIRLDYPVSDLDRARREAARLGGVIDEVPPPWAGTNTSFFLGHDPEGNVFGAKYPSS
jgi:predicted enzyme related to lactoylglutathione lyase